VVDVVSCIIFLAVWLVSVIFDLTPIVIVPVAAVVGIAVQVWRCKKK